MTSIHDNCTTLSSIYSYLFSLLTQLDGVSQSPRYHPEGDALYHSLQVFQLARAQTDDPQLWAAALLHDVGKAVDCACHAQWGGDALTGIVSERVCWLITHHLDLLKQPTRARRRHQSSPWLADLQQLRRWDTAGRCQGIPVVSVEQALQDLFAHPEIFIQ